MSACEPSVAKRNGVTRFTQVSAQGKWTWARKVRVSAIQRKVAYLALKARWKWNEAEFICQRLTEEWQRPPLLALLLPVAAANSFLLELEGLSEKGVVIEGFAETTYCGQEVCLWVLRWANENPASDPPAITLEHFASMVTAVMAPFHPPDSGPFLWPLHDKDIASAIAMCEYAGVDAPWWRKVLWALRIVQPPGGAVLEECILDHYGREVSYVFAWANVFTRFLWVLTTVCFVFHLCGARAQLGGFQGVLWYIMQFLILCWAVCLNALTGSRRSVLRSGGGLPSNTNQNQVNFRGLDPSNEPKRARRKKEVEPAPGPAPAPELPEPSPPESPQPSPPASTAQLLGAKTTMLDGVHRQSMGVSNMKTCRGLAAATTYTWEGTKVMSKDALSPQRLLEGVQEVPADRRSELAEKLQRALVKAKFIGWESKQLLVRRLNPDYSQSRCPKAWTAFALLTTAAVMAAFLLLAINVLFFFLNLKTYLIYVWGECLERQCKSPANVHGFKGLLADISADIALALVLVVLLGEVCKALAMQLAKLWNFKYMRRRQYMQAMLSLFIEVLAKVGLFSMMAFVFLPGWHAEPEKGVLPDVREACGGYVDFEICSWMFDCGPEDQLCCAGSFLCAKDLLTFGERLDLFHQWLWAPFIVCPFVDMLPAVLAPLIAKRLSKWADYVGPGTEGQKLGLGRRCLNGWASCFCCCCGRWLSRLLALIFVLDAEVTGLRYLCFGRTFGTTQLDTMDMDDDYCERCLDGPLEQVVLREFDALDELKDLKLNFLFVVLFAPVLPWAIIPSLLARLVELRIKIPKLFLVRRRSFPRDAHLVHSTQESFTDVVTTFTVFWYLGLSLVTFNTELHTWNRTMLSCTWLGSGLLGSVLVCLTVRVLRRQVEKRFGACS
ncbi:unnamed protein product [Effrenium voratum]|nr:unnamed protein product [Effrenium voratum]